ncbi:MAG: hypothetical protein JNM95_08045 [Chitinophagaceae bacterium]|nr:hypothetical protein [Chitinophagaceae bacterium]
MHNSILNKLACSLGRRDEQPNIEAAIWIASTKNAQAMKELISLLNDKRKEVQSDSIKAIYEAGERCPELLLPYAEVFIGLLSDKHNRLQWGGMTALCAVAPLIPTKVYKAVPILLEAAEKGTVITRDYAVNILVILGREKKYQKEMFLLLNEQLLHCPVNQLPSYAEKTATILTDKNKIVFLHTLQQRMVTLDIDTKRKRLEKLIRKIK